MTTADEDEILLVLLPSSSMFVFKNHIIIFIFSYAFEKSIASFVNERHLVRLENHVSALDLVPATVNFSAILLG